MKEERSGILWKQREAFLRANNNNNEYNNNDYVLAGDTLYSIKEQKKLLEEFERKKKNENIKDFYIGNEQSIF